MIGDRCQLDLLVQEPLGRAAETLIERFWPGPLTLVLPARPGLPFALTAGAATVGVRMPAHAVLCALMRRSGPLAATSANLSGGEETHSARQVAQQLSGRLPLILQDEGEDFGQEAGVSAPPAASTVVDLSGPAPRILRPGPIAAEVAAVLAEMGLATC